MQAAKAPIPKGAPARKRPTSSAGGAPGRPAPAGAPIRKRPVATAKVPEPEPEPAEQVAVGKPGGLAAQMENRARNSARQKLEKEKREKKKVRDQHALWNTQRRAVETPRGLRA